MDAPPVQYVKTSDGLAIAYTDSGEGIPLVNLPLQFNHVQLAWQTTTSIEGHPAWLHAFSRKFSARHLRCSLPGALDPRLSGLRLGGG
jgi:hypothetical protein